MAGARLSSAGSGGGGGDAAGARRVIEAGGDVLLYTRDPQAAAEGVRDLDVLDSLRRLDGALGRVRAPESLDDVSLARHRSRGRELAYQAVRLVRGELPAFRKGAAVALAIVDDDAGGPYPLPPRSAFADALGRAGVTLRPDGAPVVLLFADVKGWKGRAGVSDDARRHLEATCSAQTPVVVFGHPRRLADVPGDGPVLCAWSGDAVMQEAAARALVEGPAPAHPLTA